MYDDDTGRRQSVERAPHDQPTDYFDTAAFEVFYRQTVIELIRFLVLHGASMIDAAEVAQDTLSTAYTHWHTLDKPRPWCFRVASRELIRRVSSVHEDLVADPEAPSPLFRTTPINAWHVRHELVTALAELPPRQRQVMAWALSGYKPAEIADELNLSNDQVRANLRLARRTLAAQLDHGQDIA